MQQVIPYLEVSSIDNNSTAIVHVLLQLSVVFNYIVLNSNVSVKILYNTL